MHFCACFLFCSRFVWWYVYCSLFTTLTAFENAIHVALEIQVRIVVFVFDFFSLSTLGNYKRKKSWKIDSKKVNDENVKHTHTHSRGESGHENEWRQIYIHTVRGSYVKNCVWISVFDTLVQKICMWVRNAYIILWEECMPTPPAYRSPRFADKC